MASDGILTPGPPLDGCASESDIEKVLKGYRLTTAQILYHMPDHPGLLQEFIWQDLDHVPRFPVLTRFLDHWQRELDGKLYRVRLAMIEGLSPKEWRAIDQELTIS
jgi:uncharacterized protein Usg